MTPPPVFLDHPSSLEHDPGPHPEQAARIVAVLEELDRREWLGYERAPSPAVSREVLCAVHPEPYVAAIERTAARGGGALDADTVISEGSFVAALHACGGAVELARHLVQGGAGARGFSAHRPPGHHALSDRAMGFCLFNSIAVAARFALDALGLSRVMVVDWDVHHGNGTNDIFAASEQVLFFSIHQWPLYPGTGPASDVGHGPGRGFTVNVPVPPGTGDPGFVSLIADVSVPLARAYRPQLVLVSAGFDAHAEDPLGSCTVSDAGFAEMAASLSAVCDELGVPLGCVLEGGYSPTALARSVAATMAGLIAPTAPERRELDPLARATLERLRGAWPELAPR
jgi:acetoin utilization deacetylase AcuC-like enzyme